jgi:uncharacterized protein (DUF58 family)
MPSTAFRRCEGPSDPERRPDGTPVTRAASAAALGALMLAAGAVFDTDSLFVPGVALLLLAIGFGGWVALAARGAGISRAPGPHTVVEEQPYPLRLELRAGLLPPPGGELDDPLLERPIRIGPGASRRVRIDVRFARRGRRTLEPGSLRISDPLRIAVREIAASGPAHELLVLPRTEEVRSVRPGGGAGNGTGADGSGGRSALRGRADGSAAELDLDGLRPYREGAPATRIHWPAVARTGEMLERRLTAESDSAPLVVLDASRPPSEESLDAAVRAAASLCLHLAHSGGCALLLPGERRSLRVAPDLAGWPAAHARLAVVAATGARPALAGARRAGAVMWVSARPDPPRDLARSAGGGAWLVAPAIGPPNGAAFTVAGCVGRRLGARGAVGVATSAGAAA